MNGGAESKPRDMKLMRKRAETCATAGMLIILVSLAVPIANLGETQWFAPWKWVYSAGALIYLAARIVGSSGRDESMRMRRLRRMQSWGGVAFCIGAFFWFYSEARMGAQAGGLALLRQTILFSLVGALIEIISSWMLYSRSKKEGIEPKE